jgi:hypothetical protein
MPITRGVTGGTLRRQVLHNSNGTSDRNETAVNRILRKVKIPVKGAPFLQGATATF